MGLDFEKLYILNGATGTELMKKGYRGVRQEQWIIDNKAALIELNEEYKAAGSDVLYSPTFNTNRAKLEREGLGDKTAYYNEELVKITKESGLLVFGDIGPTGLFAKPLGKTTDEELFDIYKEQARSLASAGADAFVVETMMTPSDTFAAVKACKEVSDIPLIVSCTCDKRGRMMTGDDIISLIGPLLSMGIDSFGLNCSVGPADLLAQIERIHEAFPALPLLAKPNAGLPKNVDGIDHYDCDPLEFASYADAFIRNGVKFLGGCCGTNPEYIKEICKALEID